MESRTHPPFSANALTVLEKRYLKKDKEGKVVETPEEMLRRVAENIASAERLHNPQADTGEMARKFYRLMSSLTFLPNSPTLMNAGHSLQQLAACFVLPIEDSLESIFSAVKQSALIHQSGGGTGFSFSRVRPRQDIVGTTGGIASGPVSFIRVFNMTTEVIKQGGTRRGANMGILRVDHPDILEFISVKEDPKELTNFNLSVGVTDAFMEAVEKGETYPLLNPHRKAIVAQLPARDVFTRMAEAAWRSGEPGVIFLDHVNAHNPTPVLGTIEATNPCGEQPLLPYEACNLGSINLAAMITEDEAFPAIDYRELEAAVRLAVRFLDNVIDVNRYPLPEIEAMAKGNRKIGLGVMGFADLLLLLGIAYDSEEALQVAEEIMGFIHKAAWEESARLARERSPFPNFGKSIFNESNREPVRNATVTTVAPTGTLSILANCTSGIEPLFALSYERNVLGGIRLREINPSFLHLARREGFYSEALIKGLQEGAPLRALPRLPGRISSILRTAFDIAPEGHVRMQAAFQKHTDNAVSKTINFPPQATVEDVARVFRLAYTLGCKGITVYRSGSREHQVLACGSVHVC